MASAIAQILLVTTTHSSISSSVIKQFKLCRPSLDYQHNNGGMLRMFEYGLNVDLIMLHTTKTTRSSTYCTCGRYDYEVAINKRHSDTCMDAI